MVGCIGIHLRPVQNWTNFFVVVFSAWISMVMEDKMFQKLNKNGCFRNQYVLGMYQCLKMLVRIRGVEKGLVGSAYALH